MVSALRPARRGVLRKALYLRRAAANEQATEGYRADARYWLKRTQQDYQISDQQLDEFERQESKS